MNLKSVLAGIAIAILAVINGAPTFASTIIDQNTSGLVAPTIIDFGVSLFPTGTSITNQFSGVVFGSGFAYDANCPACNFPDVAGGLLYTPTAQSTPLDIKFTSDVSAAAFSLRMNTGTATFEGYLNGSLVATFTGATNANVNSGNYYGFAGIIFDEIKITNINTENWGGATLDNLQFNTVLPTPVPAALPLFASGLGALGLLGWRRKRKNTAASAAA